jgi:hypothetical protein
MSSMKPLPTGGPPTPLDLVILPPRLARLPTTRTQVAEPLNCQPLCLRKKCPRGFSPLRPLCAWYGATRQASRESALECGSVGRTTMGREHVFDRPLE